MEMIVKVFITLLITIEFGITRTGKTAHKTIRIPFIREDATEEEIRAVIDVMRPSLAGPVTAVNLKTEIVKTVWSPEMRKEKLEDEGEEVATERGQQTASTQSSVSPASSVQTAQVQAPVVVVGEEMPLATKGGSFALGSNHLFPARDAGPSGVGVDPALRKAGSNPKTLDPGSSPGTIKEKPGGLGAEGVESSVSDAAPAAVEGERNLSHLLKGTVYDPDPATRKQPTESMSFMDRMRANGFKVTLEEMSRSPFANTTTNKGAKPEIKKLDVPFIYVDQ